MILNVPIVGGFKMSRFKVSDKVKVYYPVDGSEEIYIVHRMFNAGSFIPELNAKPLESGYL